MYQQLTTVIYKDNLVSLQLESIIHMFLGFISNFKISNDFIVLTCLHQNLNVFFPIY